MGTGRTKIAIFIDFENLETGVRKQYDTRATVEPIISRMNEYGVTAVRRAYGDWVQHANYRHPLLQAGVELVERPNVSPGKNGADIKMAVDAVELAVRNDELDIFVLVSGNSDFLPLVHKLRELGKTVMVVGVDACTSNLLRKNCDQYFTYDSLAVLRTVDKKVPNELVKIIERAVVTRAEKSGHLLLSDLRQQLNQLDPSFSEDDFGFGSFQELVEFICDSGLIAAQLEFANAAWQLSVTGKIIVRPLAKPAPAKAVPAKAAPAKAAPSHSGGNSVAKPNKPSKPSKPARPPKPEPEPKKSEWEDRDMTEDEWDIFLEAIRKCISEGDGRPNQGKLWIINAYLHRQRLKGQLPLANQILFNALQSLAKAGALDHPAQDTYLLAEGFDDKKEDFLDDLFGEVIEEEIIEEAPIPEVDEEILEAERDYALKAAQLAKKKKKPAPKKTTKAKPRPRAKKAAPRRKK